MVSPSPHAHELEAQEGPRALTEDPTEKLQIQRSLRAPRGTESYLAIDQATGERYVTKRIENPPDGLTDRLAYETEAILENQHDHWVPYERIGQTDEGLVLVRPYISGSSLADRLTKGPMDLHEALNLFDQLLDALNEGHTQGVLHRALRPSNILFERARGAPVLRIVDGGLPPNLNEDTAAGHAALPLAIFTSPEQAGLINHEVGEWSDLYVLGLLLYTALAGSPPFRSKRFGETLRQHVTHPRPSLREAGVDVPQALDHIIQRLLRKSPRDRYHSVEGVQRDILELIRALGEGQDEPEIVIGARDPRATLTDPGFIGRHEELEELSHLLDRARRGLDGVIRLQGESGSGKTRLLDEFSETSTLSGAWVLHGDGLDATAEHPYQALQGIAEGIAQRMEEDVSFSKRLNRHLADDATTITNIFPDLASALEASTEPLGPEEYGEVRTIRALSRLFEGLRFTGQPTVLIIDDAQWADHLSKRLIQHWSTSPSSESDTGILLVAASRPEDLDQDDPLHQTDPIAEITLDPLSPEDISKVVESMAGPVPEPALDLVVRRGRGNPFLTVALLRGLVETGALVPQGDGAWTINPEKIEQAEASRRASVFLLQRFQELPEDCQQLLEIGAVLGPRFELKMAADLANTTAGAALSTLEPARHRRVVWPSSQPGLYAFSHDRLRDAILSDLEPWRRRRLHRKAAAYLEEHGPDRVFELAYHHDEADQPNQGLHHAQQAAQDARNQHALHLAEEYYRIAVRGTDPDDRETAYQIHQGLGEILLLNGDYPEAKQELSTALDLAHDKEAEIEAQRALGELAFKRGDMNQAQDRIEIALRRIGERTPKTKIGYITSLIWQTLIQTIHSLFPPTREPSGKPEARHRQAVRLYDQLVLITWHEQGPLAALRVHLRGLNLSERLDPSPERIQAYAMHGPALTQLPWVKRGEAYCREAITMAQDIENPHAEGLARHMLGAVLYASSRYEEALDELREAQRLLDLTGDRWRATNAKVHIALSLYRLGRLRQATEHAKQAHQTALEIDGPASTAHALEAWAKASDGKATIDLIDQAIQPDLDPQHYQAVLQARAIILLSQGEPVKALEALEEAEAVMQSRSLRSEYVAPIACWKATALRRVAEDTPDVASARRDDLLQQAAKQARKATRTARWYPNNRPHALRERGLIAAQRGKGKPHRWLDESLETAEEQGARAEEARTRVVIAYIDSLEGEPEANSQLERAQKDLEQLFPPTEPETPNGISLSLIDQFATVLSSGRKIAGSLQHDAILAATQKAAKALFRGHDALIVSVADPANIEPIAGDLPDGYPQAALERTLEVNRPILLPLEDEDTSGWELIEQHEASALLAPIHVQGTPRYAFIVLNKEVSGLYAEDDARIAEFLGTLAGAALESAENFERLFTLKETLEDRVTDRTQALANRTDELEEALSLHRAILDATADGILVIDMDRNIVTSNDRFQEIFDVPSRTLEEGNDEEILDHLIDQLRDPGAFRARIRELDADPAQVHHDTLEFKDGRIIERYAYPQELEGRIVGRVFSFRDVTGERNTKRHLERSNAELERFVYVASHDLQEPLRMVHSYVQMLENRYGDELDDTAIEIIEYAVEGAQRMRTLIEDLLAFSRLDTKLETLEPIALDTILDDVLSTYQVKISEVNATVNREPLPTILGDQRGIRHILQNLVSNALKYHDPDNAPHIRIWAEPDGPWWKINVEDDGIGIDPRYHDQIFEAFKRLHRHDEIQGSGIGLAICRKVVERHGGKIWVDSEPGSGTCFTFTLPALEPETTGTDESTP